MNINFGVRLEEWTILYCGWTATRKERISVTRLAWRGLIPTIYNSNSS